MITQPLVTSQPNGKRSPLQDHIFSDYTEKNVRWNLVFEFTLKLKYTECVKSEFKDRQGIAVWNAIHWTWPLVNFRDFGSI